MNEVVMRVLCAFICGTLLSISGSLSQVITHNKMSSPSTLGFNGFAVLFVLLSFFMSQFFPWTNQLSFEQLSFSVSLLMGTLFFIILGLRKKNTSYGNQYGNIADKIVLIGLCFNLLIGALFSVVQFLVSAFNIRFPEGIWFGHFRFAQADSLVIGIILLIISFAFIMINKKSIRYFNFGNDFITGLGVSIKKVESLSLVLIFLISCYVISFFGVFSFLGLLFPHLLRTLKVFKHDYFHEIAIGSLLSGTSLAMLDYACYEWTIFGLELPVGMISSLFGAMFLVFYFVKTTLKKK
jgi:iron complex transport system permease protein